MTEIRRIDPQSAEAAEIEACELLESAEDLKDQINGQDAPNRSAQRQFLMVMREVTRLLTVATIRYEREWRM